MSSLNSGSCFGAFLGSGIEFLEIVAIAYALAASGYRREALFGSAVGIVGITLVGALLGPELIFVPLRCLRIGAGLVLVYFGGKWAKKSVIRHTGGKRARWIQDPLRGRILETENTTSRFSYINFAVMTKCAALETFEVALIVITIGLSSRAWFEALSGATLALALTVLLVVVLHGRLQRLPDVFIKLGAGLMLLTLGTYWLGEGLWIKWPMGEFSVLPLFGLFVLSSWIAIVIMRRSAPKL